MESTYMLHAATHNPALLEVSPDLSDFIACVPLCCLSIALDCQRRPCFCVDLTLGLCQPSTGNLHSACANLLPVID